MEKKPYDPRLREAVLEFEALCKKYDCIGTALFTSPTHSEFKNHFESSWSVLKIEDASRLRFKSKLADFGGDPNLKHFAEESSVHALTSIVEWTRQTHDAFRQVLIELKRHMKIGWVVWDRPDSVPGMENEYKEKHV